ncbi:MAG: C1 family peptidase, partial [Planctomycetaceae bacterium]
VRLDAPNQTGKQTLKRVKAFLAAGFPAAFGFSVPNSVARDGEILYRPTFDAISGGQAVLAVGYDDRRLGSTRGALLIRNSWGAGWGDAGHAWLPYAFVEHQLAADFWTLLNPAWLHSHELHHPRLQTTARPHANHKSNGTISRPPATALAGS